MHGNILGIKFHGLTLLMLYLSGIQMEVVNSCLVNNGECGHKCIHSSGGPKCFCRDGYQLQADNKSCGGESL